MPLAGLAPTPPMAAVPRHRPAAVARTVEGDAAPLSPIPGAAFAGGPEGDGPRRCLLRGLHFSRSQLCTGRSVRSWLGGVRGPAASVRHARSPLGPAASVRHARPPLGPAAPSRQEPACSRLPPRPQPRGTGGGGLAFTGPLPSRENLIN